MISILMPVCNATPYLEDCLLSIVAQHSTNWELIAVDDFSTDESWPLLQRYAEKDPRIQVYQNTSKGIIPALQLAYAKSAGSHITRMDADDLMTPDKLGLLLEACPSHGLSTGLVEYFRDDAPLGDGYKAYADWLNELCRSQSHWQHIYKECVMPSPAWMMSRESFDSIGAFDSERYPEDYDLAFRAYDTGLAVSVVNKLVHRWRDHGSRASRTDANYSDNRFLDIKLHYFLKTDQLTALPLALWGAGKKGKYIAKNLIQAGIRFSWHTDNPNKIGVDIYGVILQSSKDIPAEAQCLLSMASPQEQLDIKARIAEQYELQAFWLC